MLQTIIHYNSPKIQERAIWKTFVDEHPNGNIFHAPEFYDVYLNTDNYTPVTILARDKNTIVGLVCAVIQKERSGFLGYFTSRCIIFGGPLVQDNNETIARTLIEELVKQVRRKSIYIQFRNLHVISHFREVFNEFSFFYHPHLDIHIDLSPPFEELKKSMHSSRLRNQKKSLRKGLNVKNLTSWAEIKEGYKLVDQTYRRVGLPSPDLSLYKAIYDHLLPKNIAGIYGAVLNDNLIGFRMVLKYKDCIYDYYAGSLPEHNNKYPNDVLILHVLDEGCQNAEYKYFDFGGAGKPGEKYGVRDHKLKFGGQLVEYGRYTRVNNKLVYYLASWALILWKKIKGK